MVTESINKMDKGSATPKHPLTPDQLNELVDWLFVNGDKIEYLNKLKAEALANPVKRHTSHYRVKNPDGSIYRRPQRKASGRRQLPKSKTK